MALSMLMTQSTICIRKTYLSGDFKTMRKLRVTHWLSLLLIMLSVAIAGAQTLDGTLRGEVSDPSGAVVAGAKVTATNTATNISVETTTTTSGTFNIPNLLPGMYRVTVEVGSFD